MTVIEQSTMHAVQSGARSLAEISSKLERVINALNELSVAMKASKNAMPTSGNSSTEEVANA